MENSLIYKILIETLTPNQENCWVTLAQIKIKNDNPCGYQANCWIALTFSTWLITVLI